MDEYDDHDYCDVCGKHTIECYCFIRRQPGPEDEVCRTPNKCDGTGSHGPSVSWPAAKATSEPPDRVRYEGVVQIPGLSDSIITVLVHTDVARPLYVKQETIGDDLLRVTLIDDSEVIYAIKAFNLRALWG